MNDKLAQISIVVFTGMCCTNLSANASAVNTHSQVSSQTPITQSEDITMSLASIKNFQHNTAFMYSSGLPNETQFALLKENGFTHVIDLIPGDRAAEIQTTAKLGLNYFNVPVEWEAPTLANFLNYVAYMESIKDQQGTVLTHCKLNWRGAAFTYLYRVAILGESEVNAKEDLLAIWQPNPVWYALMRDVLAHFNSLHGTNLTMSFTPSPTE